MVCSSLTCTWYAFNERNAAGVYTCLFVEACYIMTKKCTKNASPGRVSRVRQIWPLLGDLNSQKVFLIMMFYMYALSTVHIGMWSMLRKGTR